jgi:hypothetical protein
MTTRTVKFIFPGHEEFKIVHTFSADQTVQDMKVNSTDCTRSAYMV